MNKNLIFVLFFTASIVFGQANVPAIVVSTFSARGQAVSADDAETITELFISELAKTGGLRVVDRTSLDRVISEMSFQTSDWSNSQKTARLGAALNANYLVRGQISQLGQQITVNISALDINTLEVISPLTETFDINVIYDTKEDRWYDKKSIIGKMPFIAESIIKPIIARFSPSLLVGRWRSNDNRAIIEFRTDGSIVVEKYDFSWSSDGIQYSTSGSGIATGTGNYVFGSPDKGSPIIINLSLKSTNNLSDYFSSITYSGTLQWNNTSKNNFTFKNGTITRPNYNYTFTGNGLPHGYSSRSDYYNFSNSFFRIE